VGTIEDADAVGTAGSLVCGDQLKIYLKIKDNIVTDAKFQTFGCGSAVASSSILTEMIIGKSVDEVKKITNKDIADQLDGLPPEKMHCSVMGYEALEDAFKNYEKDGYVPLEQISKQTEEKMICTCFQVTDKVIIDAIKTNNLKTVEDVTNYTKAGGACGRCKDEIQKIIDNYYNGVKPTEEKAEKMTPTQWILKVNNIIENQISPELTKDGGDIELVDIKDKDIYVKLKGMCSGCKNSTITLKTFVETTLKHALGDDINVIEVK
jgi:NifU-like protein